MLSAAGRLPCRSSRVLVGGASGSGKTTVAGRIALMIGASHTEIDSLQHEPGWTVRPEFIDDVAALAAEQQWVTEYQQNELLSLMVQHPDLSEALPVLADLQEDRDGEEARMILITAGLVRTYPDTYLVKLPAVLTSYLDPNSRA